jgi:hypothetical protein
MANRNGGEFVRTRSSRQVSGGDRTRSSALGVATSGKVRSREGAKVITVSGLAQVSATCQSHGPFVGSTQPLYANKSRLKKRDSNFKEPQQRPTRFRSAPRYTVRIVVVRIACCEQRHHTRTDIMDSFMLGDEGVRDRIRQAEEFLDPSMPTTRPCSRGGGRLFGSLHG